MTYGGQYPGTGGFPGGGRHRSAGADPVDLIKTTAYTTGPYAPTRGEPLRARAVPPESEYRFGPGEPEESGSDGVVGDGVVGDGRPPRHPWILAAVVGVTVFLATITVGGTVLAVNDSRARKAENYQAGPPTSTVTVTESVTTTTTTTVTSTPSRSARPSDSPNDSTAATAAPGWYAQFGSFTVLEMAQELASRVGGEVYHGEEFGQPGQYIVAQREYSRSSASDACDIAEQSCIVKQVQ